MFRLIIYENSADIFSTKFGKICEQSVTEANVYGVCVNLSVRNFSSYVLCAPSSSSNLLTERLLENAISRILDMFLNFELQSELIYADS